MTLLSSGESRKVNESLRLDADFEGAGGLVAQTPDTAEPASDHIGDGNKMGGPGGLISRAAAANAAYVVCAETRHVSLGLKASDAIRALPAAAQGEPVAWRARLSETENWYLFDKPVFWWEVQPLYAHPCDASLRAEVEQMRDYVRNTKRLYSGELGKRLAAEARIAELEAERDFWRGAVASANAERDAAQSAAKEAEQIPSLLAVIDRLEAERPALIAAAYEDAARIAGERCAACGAREISGLVKEHILRATPAALEQAKAGAVTDAAQGEPVARKYEARACKSMPAECCDYGVISLDTGMEICRVWTENDVRLISDLLNAHPSDASLRAEVERLRKTVKNLNAAWESCIVEREAAEARIAELEARNHALMLPQPVSPEVQAVADAVASWINSRDGDDTVEQIAVASIEAFKRAHSAELEAERPALIEAAPDWTEAARHMLETFDAWFSGDARDQSEAAHRLILAGSFAAQAFEDLSASGATADGAPVGMMRTFLLALIDPALPELDPLRACNRTPADAILQPAQAGEG
ncbi:hypothetical protein [Pseudogemmobacter faecipullorum]|uniref:Uncharacterized protein n=1 Tax=Pseudogemmobacter faecipullorum TaxID=2755041 RepID=A0ABS8CQ35_9RHOB|nr:hypothetical protein [Pseudogemmobacter faecipullorum]MCB5411492.1 hypothetical protein [Pseudogemmobacter faecipullorum]